MKRVLLMAIIAGCSGSPAVTDGGTDAGACARDCLGGACVAGVCQPVRLIDVPSVGGLALGGIELEPAVFWTSTSGDVGYTVPARPSVGTLATVQKSPRGIAADAKAVYWVTNDAAGKVMKRPLGNDAGQTSIALVSGQVNPLDLAVNDTHVYWVTTGASLGQGAVLRVPLGGGAVTELASAQSPSAMVLNATHVFWANTAGDGSIMSMPLDGAPPTVLTSGQPTPTDLAVDASNVYFLSGRNVFKVSLSGGPASVIATGQSAGWSIAVDQDTVYWAEGDFAQANGLVSKVSVNGGTVTILAQAQRFPGALVVDATSLYWGNRVASGELMRLAK